MTSIEYVDGFYFSHDLKFVLLIRKAKPEWQRGKLNGIGGKIDYIDGRLESPNLAMIREFYEETGISTTITDWTKFCVLSCKSSRIYFYALQSEYLTGADLLQFVGLAKDADPSNPEIIEVRAVGYLGGAYIPNLDWLIPMAINRLTNLDGSFDVLEC